MHQRHIDDLVRQLQAARIENDRMRQAIIPPINLQEVTILLNENLPYVWQQSLVSALRVEIEAHPEIDFNNNMLIATVWRTIHEEIRNRRQGRHSAAVANPAYQPLVFGGYNTPGGCHRCGQHGHWARDCPTSRPPTYAMHQPAYAPYTTHMPFPHMMYPPPPDAHGRATPPPDTPPPATAQAHAPTAGHPYYPAAHTHQPTHHPQ